MNSLSGLDPKVRKANIRLAIILALVAVGFYLVMMVLSQ